MTVHGLLRPQVQGAICSLKSKYLIFSFTHKMLRTLCVQALLLGFAAITMNKTSPQKADFLVVETDNKQVNNRISES